jgi:hypothetical protein
MVETGGQTYLDSWRKHTKVRSLPADGGWLSTYTRGFLKEEVRREFVYVYIYIYQAYVSGTVRGTIQRGQGVQPPT